MKGLTTLCAVLLGFAIISPPPVHAASLWQSASVGIGANGAWFDGGDIAAMRDIEATGRGAVSLTPHVSVVGGLAYGFSNSYTRSSVGVRLTATDASDPNFSVGIGISRHFHSEPGGLDEFAGEAGVGWKPLESSPILLTASSAYGLDTSRRLFTIGLVYPIKLVF